MEEREKSPSLMRPRCGPVGSVVLGHSLMLIRACVVLLLLSGWTGAIAEENSLKWDAAGNRVTAKISGGNLTSVLGKIARATGWKIFVEKNITNKVSASFQQATAAEAMRLMFGDLNFALLPQPGGASKLFIYKTSLTEATEIVPPSTEGKPLSKNLVPNELVVTLNAKSKMTIEELAKKLGAKIVSRSDAQKAYRLRFDDEEATRAASDFLASNTDIGQADSNYYVDRPTRTDNLELSSNPPFSLKPKTGADGGKVIVGLIDMPVQRLAEGMNEFLLPSLLAGPGDGARSEQLSHGTSMAETILQGVSLASQGESSPIRILPVDVYGGSETTTTYDVTKGVYMAINSGATIINLSLGGDDESPYLKRLIADAKKQGVLFFGAAGNAPSTDPTYPAAYPEVIAVTAGDRRGNIAAYANRGQFVDVIAPGTSVVEFNDQSFLVSGTSTATAYMTGTAAAIRATGKTAAQVETILRESFAVTQKPRR